MAHTQYCLITGCSRGIGKAVVRQLLQKGIHVIAVTRNRNCFSGQNRNTPGKLIPYYIDVTKTESRKELIDELHRDNIKVNSVLNNAGLLIKKGFEELTEDDLIQMFAVNSIAPHMLFKDLYKNNCLAQTFSVTNISSIGGVEDSKKFPGLSGYGASKAAVNAWTQSMPSENKNGYFNAIAPGAVGTEMQKQAFPDLKPPMSADEFAHFVAYFITEGYRFFNGQILKVKLEDP